MNVNIFRSALHICAICGLYLATAMFIPALVDIYYGFDGWKVFALSGFMVGGLSLMTATATHGVPTPFNKRFGFVLVNMLWSVFSLVGAVPLYLSELDLSFAQALFESVSAVTTTGSTVIVGLDHTPPGILMWRSLLCWLGGIGIVALGLFVLPMLRVGGMSFFKMESSDTNERPFDRLASFTRAFIVVYVLITLACAIAYDFAGMSHFDAIIHAMPTIATSGFSSHDASFGYFDSRPLMWIATFFMTLCSLPFTILIVLALRGRTFTLRDPQISVFLGYLCVISVVVAIYHHLRNGVEFGDALTRSFFNIASILSTSGFASEDYMLWGPFVAILTFFAMIAGGCSGSTSGGIKTYRLIIMFNIIRTGVKKLLYPDAIYSVRYGDRVVDAETQRGVLIFFSLFVILWIVGSIAMGALGYDLMTSVSAVMTTLANVGPGVGPVIGPVGNFSTIRDPALYLLSLLMLLGRLEILSVMVLFMPMFWRN